MKHLQLALLIILAFINDSAAQLNIQFRSQLQYGASNELANIGGFVDTLGKEYALVGCQTGLSIVDVTNPAAPVQKFLVPGTNSFWREVKVHGRYAYVTTEGCCNGLQIIDLRNLPASVTSKYWKGNGAILDSITRLHSLHIDNGYAYLNGSQIKGGACLIVSLADPWNPVYMGNTVLSFTGNHRYMHDCFVRNDTLWGAHIYGGFFSVINVTNKSAPVVLATQPTPNAFTHNAWLNTSGARTLFTTDETSNSFMASYDVTNLANITLLDKVQLNAGSTAIVHNTHVKNNYAIVSWYKEGVAIVDVSRPDNLIITGSYDTYSQGSGNGFNGCWGVYPFLPSGNIVASDINNGLFVLTPTYVRGCYLEGIIRNACTNVAIPTVTVTITGANVTKASKITGVYKMGTAAAGTYSVTFTKTGYQTKTITGVVLSNGVLNSMNVNLTPVNPVNITNGVVTNSNCNGAATGAINITASGGTTPYTWQWSNGALSEDISAVVAGTYTVTVTDVVGCTSTASYTITQPSLIQIGFTSTPISCTNAQNGSITATFSGGVSPYTFNWVYPPSSPFANRQKRLASHPNSVYPISSLSSNSTISNLAAGTYYITVTDANGCSVTSNYNLINPVNPCSVTLSLKLFIEGFYRTGGSLVSTNNPGTPTNLADTIMVELHAAQSPYPMQHQATALLDTTGNCTIVFPGSIWMNNYYITVKHRNSLQTWSKLPVTFGGFNFYDFTLSSAPINNNQYMIID